MTTLTTRALGNDDWPEALRLGIEGFGGKAPDSPPEVWPREGQSVWGTFHEGRLVARLAGHAYHSWFDGVAVPTLGVAGVTVEAEHRGQGLLTPLFEALLDSTDAPISTLYPTAPGIYRSLGYELVSTLREVDIPTADLAGVRPVTAVATRRATEGDVDAVQACYTRWAREQNGPLTRTAPLFDPAEILTEGIGTTLAVDADDAVVGFAHWDRGTGYDKDTVIRVHDLVADTDEAARALWHVFGTFSSVAGRIRLTTSGDDLTRLALPSAAWHEAKANPYMLRILDLAGALELRRPSPAIRADLAFGVRGDRLGRIDGDWTLQVADGEVRCASGPAAERVYTPTGIALAYAGVQSSANLRRAGLLVGPTDGDATWDALLAGRPVHVRDYF